MPDYLKLPEGLKPPVHDDAADHLPGMRLPVVALSATNGQRVDLGHRPGLIVLYAYPMTGRPGEPLPGGWDDIPGARGCTPQACAFRDHFAELKELGVREVFGVSTQSTAYQREAADRLHLPFPLLSDADGALTEMLDLPTFEAGGETLLKRLTIVALNGTIEKVFYPVFPPDRNAGEVVAYLREGTRRLKDT